MLARFEDLLRHNFRCGRMPSARTAGTAGPSAHPCPAWIAGRAVTAREHDSGAVFAPVRNEKS